jgi:hypothetical protein
MPKYKAAFCVSDTWEVVFDAPESMDQEELEELAHELCFNSDHPDFDDDKRWCRSDTEDELVFMEKLED